MRKVIFNLINEHKGHWNNVYDSILSKEKPTIEMKGDEIEYIYDNSLFIVDDEYSDKFKKMYMPPFALFYHGNINLINENVLSILGNIDLNDIQQLETFKNNDYVICLYQQDVNEEMIVQLINKEFKLILLTNKKLDYTKQINNNIVYVSEFCTNKIDYDEKHIVKRLMYSIGDSILLKDKKIENIEIIITNYKNEEKNCFLLSKNIQEDINEIFDEKIFHHIKGIEEIIKVSKS